MVIVQRSTSDSYINRFSRNDKFQLRRGTSGGSSQPLLPTFSENVSSSSSFKTSRLSYHVTTIIKALFLISTLYLMYSLRIKLVQREEELTAIRRDFEYIEEALQITEAEVGRARSSLESIQSKFSKLLPQGQEAIMQGEDVTWDEMYNKIVNRQEAMKRRVNELQQTIADLHRGEAIEHFGPGTHHLRFNLSIENEVYSFVVEMAPIDLMPHSVNYFLEMVKAKVWDNTVFTHGSSHIMFGELQDYDGNDKRDEQLSSLSFPEYSDEYPHEKYTLGLSGRPGGPEFYINIENNTRSHGPGGQAHHALHEEADPCFGKVVEGTDVIDWMIEKRNTGGAMRTAILSVEILQQ